MCGVCAKMRAAAMTAVAGGNYVEAFRTVVEGGKEMVVSSISGEPARALRHKPSGKLYAWTKALAKRADMEEVTPDEPAHQTG